MLVKIPISLGELVDKISILRRSADKMEGAIFIIYFF